MSDSIRSKTKEYILENFVFEENGQIGDDQSLIRSGVLDSTGILELIVFVENEFNVSCNESELVKENFDTINLVTAFVTRKLQLKPVA